MTELHWADRRFDASFTGGLGTEQGRLRDRFHRTRILNRILRHYGLEIDDDWSSTTLALANRQGDVALIQNLGQLWPAAQRMAGRALDPLDKDLVAALGDERGDRGP